MSIIIYSEESDFKPMMLECTDNILVHINDAPEWTCEYSRDVIKGRWPEAEPIIMQNPVYWEAYCKHFAMSDCGISSKNKLNISQTGAITHATSINS